MHALRNLASVRFPHVSQRLSCVLYVFYHVLVSVRLPHVSQRFSRVLYVFYYVLVSVSFPQRISEILTCALCILLCSCLCKVSHVSQTLFRSVEYLVSLLN